jgi:hypothetical protein
LAEREEEEEEDGEPVSARGEATRLSPEWGEEGGPARGVGEARWWEASREVE